MYKNKKVIKKVSVSIMIFFGSSAHVFIFCSCILGFSASITADALLSQQQNDVSCNEGEIFGCFSEILTESLTCRDLTSCIDIYNCDEIQTAYRSGQLCQSFPFYNGGYPMGDGR